MVLEEFDLTLSDDEDGIIAQLPEPVTSVKCESQFLQSAAAAANNNDDDDGGEGLKPATTGEFDEKFITYIYQYICTVHNAFVCTDQ